MSTRSFSDEPPAPGDRPPEGAERLPDGRRIGSDNLADAGWGEVPADGTFGEGPSFGTSAVLGGNAGGASFAGRHVGPPAKYVCEIDGPLEPDEVDWGHGMILSDPHCRKCGRTVQVA